MPQCRPGSQEAFGRFAAMVGRKILQAMARQKNNEVGRFHAASMGPIVEFVNP
jgi:hypothetical protein